MDPCYLASSVEAASAEFPQLFNVIRRNIALVGSRLEMLFLGRAYEPWQQLRLLDRPVIAGLW